MNKDKELMIELSEVLENGEIIIKKNSILNDVRVKRGGLKEGLVHLIDHRIKERVFKKDVNMNIEKAKIETSAILFLAIDNIDKSPAILEKNGNYGIYHNGIKTIITKDKKGHYVLSGYDNKQTKKEATDSINAVIAEYGKSPEFLGIYAQVGAVIASYNILPQTNKLSSKTPIKIKVNGKERECKNGLLQGFKNAVSRLDELHQELNIVKSENEELHKIIDEKLNRNNKAEDFEIEY